MNETQQIKIMRSIFSAMMVGGHLNNQMQMAKELKAIHYLLKEQEHLSEQERDNCLFYFFKEYALGCKPPISDLYIRNNRHIENYMVIYGQHVKRRNYRSSSNSPRVL